MIDLLCQGYTNIFATLTPLLVGVMICSFAYPILVHLPKYFFSKIKSSFINLTHFNKLLVILSFSLFTLWGGSKNQTSQGVAHSAQGVPDVENISQKKYMTLDQGNVGSLRISSFTIDKEEQMLAFETSWDPYFFDSTFSRGLYLLMSTNLLEREWIPLRAFDVPLATNSCCFTVSSHTVDSHFIPQFRDAFNGKAFFSFVPDNDFDKDGISNFIEYKIGINPTSADSDGDIIQDCVEMGSLCTTNNISWVDDFIFRDDITDLFSNPDASLVNYNLPLPISVSHELITNIIIDLNGIIYLPRKGFGGDIVSQEYSDLTMPIYTNALVVAPYHTNLYLSQICPTSKVLVGTAIVEKGTFFVVQYDHVCLYSKRNILDESRSFSFQVLFPLNGENEVHIIYKNIQDEDINNVNATIGLQSLGGNWSYMYSNDYYDMVLGNSISMWTLVTKGLLYDGLVLTFKLGTGTVPDNIDSDGDGLNDNWEMSLNTSPLLADTDGDGMADDWEIVHSLDPSSAYGGNDGGLDADQDGLSNYEEFLLNTNPRLEDTDGDGVSDLIELTMGANPLNEDSDKDGLADGFEISLNLNPLQPDTDGDGLTDEWEYEYRNAGFDPTIKNISGSTSQATNGDYDGDGLINKEECEWGTNPTIMDSDGDGISDGLEVSQNSDPADASDNGVANSRIQVPFYFGDPSGSHSEKYRLEVIPISGEGEMPSSFSWINANYGECETRIATLKAGWKYEIRLAWSACKFPSDGKYYPNYDYTLKIGDSTPPYVVLNDANKLFRTEYYGDEYYGSSHFPVLDNTATVTVYKVTSVKICKSDDSSWEELEESQVILDDQELRIKINVIPQLESLSRCQEILKDQVIVKTSGTCPDGVSLPIGDGVVVKNINRESEIRITKTIQQLRNLHLLPQNDEDGVNEMAWYDTGEDSPSAESNLSDSRRFSEINYHFRGQVYNSSLGDINSKPPVSKNSESFYKAAGSEIITAHYMSIDSKRYQVMNQADYFYYSGHGDHSTGNLIGISGGPSITPSLVSSYWNRDLKCVIFAGCSVLDINDYNGNYKDAVSHTSSPGKSWAKIEGPDTFLGYAFFAPLDTQGADTIMHNWVINRKTMSDVDAWMRANDNRNGRNACAIDSARDFHYFKKVFWKTYKRTKVLKARQ